MSNTEEKILTIEPIITKTATVTIEGDTDLVLNKMNARNERALTGARDPNGGGKKVKEEPNVWEDIITAMHWRDGISVKNTYTDCNEKVLKDMLKNNAPCITAFGLKQSFGDAIVRNEIDKYKTKFANAVNIINSNGLVPIKFSQHFVDTKLMSPKKGAPVLVKLNRFTGWSADIEIQFTSTVYNLESIVNTINLAGFGLGIGSGRSSGYGRYHVINVKM